MYAMKAAHLTVIIAAASFAGCAPDEPKLQTPGGMGPCVFGAARIRVIGLTRLASSPDSNGAVLTACIDVLDSYDSHIKAPGTFRFELYEYVPRSSEPRGRRLMIWPDLDLTDPAANNEYWQDYLRTYQFALDLDCTPVAESTYTLEVTCITPAGRRLTDKRQITVK